MAGDRTNQLRRHRRTPDTEPELLEQWQHEYRTLIEEQGMKPHPAYQIIADKYKVSRYTVCRHLNPDIRRAQNNAKKNQSTSYRKTDRFRAIEASRVYLGNHFDSFVIQAFGDQEKTLTLDQLADRFYDRLVEIERVGVFMKPQTILRHSAKYDPPLLEEVVTETKPRLYQLHTAYKQEG